MSLTVIIPACNEASVISRCLAAITDGAEPGALEVIVVCNGCTDRTAEVARAFGGPVRVIETHVASKPHALNLGDSVAADFPRFYVDADVVIRFDSIRRIAEDLGSPGALVAGPKTRLDLEGASWAVRAFYRIDSKLPSHHEGIGGTGVYAVSEAGRKRWGEFPAITADDAFVKRQFSVGQKVVAKDAYSIVRPPRKLAGVVAIKTRSHFGNYEIRSRFPDLANHRGRGNARPLVGMLALPTLWPSLFVYAYVKVIARARAYWRFRSGRGRLWARDDSSRADANAASPTPAGFQRGGARSGA